MPTKHRRIQVTEDPELAAALEAAAEHLPSGLSRAGQVRELALAGARQLPDRPLSEEERRAGLEQLADWFRHPETAPWDWEVLRDIKRQGWRTAW